MGERVGRLFGYIYWLTRRFTFWAVEVAKPDVATFDTATPVDLDDLSHAYSQVQAKPAPLIA